MKSVKNFFMRHLISLPISVSTWLVLLFGAGMNYFVASGLFFLVYFGSSFTIKQIQTYKEINMLDLTRSEYQYIQQQLKTAKAQSRKLNSYYGKVRSMQAFRQLHSINTTARKIISIVQENPKKFYSIENFFYAHLDSAVELTSKYALLVNQPIKDQEVKTALHDTRFTLQELNTQLESDLKNALASDIETLKMEIDFVDVTLNKNNKKLELKGDSQHDK